MSERKQLFWVFVVGQLVFCLIPGCFWLWPFVFAYNVWQAKRENAR